MTLELTGPAERDILEAKEWLAERSPELPGRFVLSLDATFQTIVEHPEMYPQVHRNSRRAPTKTFFWAVF